MSFDASAFGDGGGGDPGFATDGSTYPGDFSSDQGPIPFVGYGSGDTGPTSDANALIDTSQIDNSVPIDPSGTGASSVIGGDSTNAGLGSSILGGIGDFFSGAGGVVSDLVNGLSAAVGGVGAGLGSVLTKAAPSLGPALGKLIQQKAGVSGAKQALNFRYPAFNPGITSRPAPVASHFLYGNKTPSGVTPFVSSGGDLGIPTETPFSPSLGDYGPIGFGTGGSDMSMAPFNFGTSLPGGASSDPTSSFLNNALSWLTGGGQPSDGGLSNTPLIGPNPIGSALGASSGVSIRPMRGPVAVQYVTPSGKTATMYYVPRGRALLFSGDLAACKRVRKVAAHARRAYGGHRSYSRARRRYR